MIMKVEQKHVDKAYEVLEKIVTRHSMEPVQGTPVYNDIAAGLQKDPAWRDSDGGIINSGEIFPQIQLYRDAKQDDPDNPIIYGGGILTLAFLIQEEATLGDNLCTSCAKKPNCSTAYMNNCIDAWSSREIAEDYLDFLQLKYPGLYIPKYKSKDLGLDWADLLANYIRLGDGYIKLSIGIPQPVKCPRYSTKANKLE